jgi:hypothetical protein
MIILIIISINIFSKKENLTSPNILNSEVYSNIQNICNLQKTSYFNRLNISGNTKIKNKILNRYIYDIIYPIGSFYVQYSQDVTTGSIWDSFSEFRSPNKLFPGTLWEKKWNTEGVFFRTEGALSEINRQPNGIQDWALKRLWGVMSPGQANTDGLWGQEGVFTASFGGNIRADTNKGGRGAGFRHSFDSSLQMKRLFNSSNNETRVKNKNMIVWKRTS